MVKKIMKYAKFMVCIILMVSLVAPSYAALSASDGSAFVTKAEFDSALADFNARLTTFEAGINSKIDSQVTSYLDRNGIWNGAKQTLINLDSHNRTELFMWNELCGKASLAALNSVDKYLFPLASVLQGGIMYKPHADFWQHADNCQQKIFKKLKIVNNITKSGLAFVHWKQLASDPKYWALAFYPSKMNGDWTVRLSLDAAFAREKTSEDDLEMLSSYTVYNTKYDFLDTVKSYGDFEFPQNINREYVAEDSLFFAKSLGLIPIDNVALFFVSKNDKIWWTFPVTYGTDSSNTPWCFCSWSPSLAQFKNYSPRFQILDFSVY